MCDQKHLGGKVDKKKNGKKNYITGLGKNIHCKEIDWLNLETTSPYNSHNSNRL